MALATFSDLLAALQDETGRSDVSSNRMELLCSQVEADLNNRRDFSIEAAMTNATVSTTASVGTVALASDVKWISRVWIDNTAPDLAYATQSQIVTLYPNNSSGQPEWFSLEGGPTMRFAPLPDGVYAVNYRYGANVPALTSASPTNWLLTAHPLIYLYGASAFNYLKLKDFPQYDIYRNLYESMIQGLMGANDRFVFPSTIPMIPIVSISCEPY